jgi:precorrin-6A/cobalt-precorrin-6A reductase
VILLLGGTSETAPIAQALASAECNVLVSTTGEADLCVEDDPHIYRRSGPLTLPAMIDLIRTKPIHIIVDATHPYAAEVTENARRAADTAAVERFRFVRPPTGGIATDIPSVTDHDEAAVLAFTLGRTVLLTTGSRHLAPYIQEASEVEGRLYARILDTPASIAAAHEAGLAVSRIIAERGPFTVEENLEHIRATCADVVVTKDGGTAGGVPAKLEAARMAGCRTVMVQRPSSSEERSFGDYHSLVEAVVRTYTNYEG